MGSTFTKHVKKAKFAQSVKHDRSASEISVHEIAEKFGYYDSSDTDISVLRFSVKKTPETRAKLTNTAIFYDRTKSDKYTETNEEDNGSTYSVDFDESSLENEEDHQDRSDEDNSLCQCKNTDCKWNQNIILNSPCSNLKYQYHVCPGTAYDLVNNPGGLREDFEQ
ncbi:hypothetical protein Trydic_g21889 [Trypoxylus dichotomus]